MVDLRGADALLLYGDSERNTDLFYITGFRAPDPFVFIQTDQGNAILTNDLEVDRAKDQAKVDQVLSTSHYARQLGQEGGRADADQVLGAFLKDQGARRLLLPADFPLGKAESLRAAGFEFEIAPQPLFPQRQVKSPEEVEAIVQAQRAAEAGMAAAVELLKAAEVRDGTLYSGGQVLTSEAVRRQIHRQLIDADCSADHTIVAGGDQGCDPHQEGSGPLRAGQPIVIDIFPRSNTSGYYGDLTRTLVKGQAPEAVRQLYQTVLEGQQLALQAVRAGADGRQIHQQVIELFERAGYPTGEKDGYLQGFFHGTGHGLGLEIHDAPSIGTRGTPLETGQVVTVEPGLYYRGLGGVRIEDLVVVEDAGCRNLTECAKFLEI